MPLRADFTLDVDAMLEAIAREQPALVWLAYPNNPTGNLFAAADVERIIRAAPGIVAVDEAYYAYAESSFLPRVLEFANLVVVRTLSKIGLAGVRLGYAVAHPAWIAEIEKVRPPYNVNALTQAVVPVLLEHGALLAEQAAHDCAANASAWPPRWRRCAGSPCFRRRPISSSSGSRTRSTGLRHCAMRAYW